MTEEYLGRKRLKKEEGIEESRVFQSEAHEIPENLVNKSINEAEEVIEEEKKGQSDEDSDKIFTDPKQSEYSREEEGLNLEEENDPPINYDPVDKSNKGRNRSGEKIVRKDKNFFTEKPSAPKQGFKSSIIKKYTKVSGNIDISHATRCNPIIKQTNIFKTVKYKKGKKTGPPAVDESTQSNLPVRHRKRIRDKDNKNKNYEKNEALIFLVQLAIILEGNDYCSAVGWEYGTDKIFVSYNNFGHEKKKKKAGKKARRKAGKKAAEKAGKKAVEKAAENLQEIEEEIKEEIKEEIEEETKGEIEEKRKEEIKGEGKDRKRKEKDEHHKKNKKNQTDLVNLVIQNLYENNIDLMNFNSCKNLLEILFVNVCYALKYTNYDFYDKRDEIEKNKILRYLHLFLKSKRPKRVLRKSLEVSHLLASPRIQNKIKRFVWAIRNILKSDIYKKYILKGKIKIEIEHRSSPKVHSELKIVDYFIQRDILKTIKDQQATHPKYLEDFSVDKQAPKKIYVVPSRLPCNRCFYALKEIDKHFINKIKFIFPKKNSYKRKKFGYVAPDFLKNAPSNYEDLNEDDKKFFSVLGRKISKIKAKAQKKEPDWIIKTNSDDYKSQNEHSQYTFKNLNSFSISSIKSEKDEQLENVIIMNSTNSLKYAKDFSRWNPVERDHIRIAKELFEREAEKIMNPEHKESEETHINI